MATIDKPQAKLIWTVILVVVGILVVGWVAYDALPRPTKGAIGLVPKVDRFSYSSWRTELDLVKDSDGDAQLTITETIVARFPDKDQNRGIVRGLPAGTMSAITDLTVTDGDGHEIPYDTEFDYDNEMVWVLTGDNDYVRGEQTYVIRYTATRAMVTNAEGLTQELYWNLLPLDSAQAIDRFSATIRIDPTLTDALNGDSACYQGRFGSTDQCTLTGSVAPDGAQVYELGSGPRRAGDGVTIAIGFEPQTVENARYQRETRPGLGAGLRSFADQGSFGVLLVLIGAGVTGFGLWRHSKWLARIRPEQLSGLPPVPAAGVPTTVPPPVAAAVLNADSDPDDRPVKDTNGAESGHAEIIHLAVQDVIRLEQSPKAKGRGQAVTAFLTDRERALHRLDQEMLEVLFPGGITQRELPKKDQSFANAVRKVGGRGKLAALQQGFLFRPLRVLTVLLGILGCLLAALGGIIMVIGTIGGFSIVVGIAGLIAQIPLAFAAVRPDPIPTERGQAVRSQLLGVRAHVEDRPSNEVLAAADPERILQMERVLPYAVLFGKSKSWGKALSVAYEGSGHHPLWMTGGDNANFHNTWSSVGRTVQRSSTYVAPASSSSSSGGGGYSGGSSGGGFSGGGGGGGFSGGR